MTSKSLFALLEPVIANKESCESKVQSAQKRIDAVLAEMVGFCGDKRTYNVMTERVGTSQIDVIEAHPEADSTSEEYKRALLLNTQMRILVFQKASYIELTDQLVALEISEVEEPHLMKDDE